MESYYKICKYTEVWLCVASENTEQKTPGEK